MVSYVHGSNWSYKDFLQAKQFDDSHRLVIETATLKQIASDQELANDGAKLYRETTAAHTDRLVEAQQVSADRVTGALTDHARLMSEGFTILHYDLTRAEQGIKEISDAVLRQTTLLDWRMSQAVAALGKIDASLDTLIKIARTPSQTWAYEQFEIAHESFNRDLFNEAVTAMDHAINGFSSHTGYPLEPRFHYLLGTIYLTSPELLNLDAAEKCFNRSAQVAGKQDPSMTSRAYCASGYAAYCQGRLEEARKYLDLAKGLDGTFAEAYFMSGKIYAHVGAVEAATKDLISALKTSRRYAQRAGEDADYQKEPEICRNAITFVTQGIAQVVDKLSAAARHRCGSIRDAVVTIGGLSAGPARVGLSKASIDPFESSARLFENIIMETKTRMQSGTLFGCTDSQLAAIRLAPALSGMVSAAVAWMSNVQRHAEESVVNASVTANRNKSATASDENIWSGKSRICGIIVFLIVTGYIWLYMWLHLGQPGFVRDDWGDRIVWVVLGGPMCAIAGGLAGGLAYVLAGGYFELRAEFRASQVAKRNAEIDKANAKRIEEFVPVIQAIEKSTNTLAALNPESDTALRIIPIGLGSGAPEGWASGPTR